MLYNPAHRRVRRASRLRHLLRTHGEDAPLHEKLAVTALALSLPWLVLTQLAPPYAAAVSLPLPGLLHLSWLGWDAVAILLLCKWTWQDRGHVPPLWVIWQPNA